MVKSSKTQRGVRRQRWIWGALASTLVLAGCYRGGAEVREDGDEEEEETAGEGGVNDSDADLVGPGTCVDTDKFFKEQVWAGVLADSCIACHNPTGQAKDTDLVLQMADYPGYLEVNKQTIENMSRLEIDDVPLLLAKPSGLVDHGGGLVLPSESDGYALMEDMILRFAAPTHCKNDGDIDRFFDGLQELDEEETLRKAVFLLASRQATEEELAAVRGNGVESLDAVLDEVLREEGFYVRIKEIINDMLHTDAFRIGDDAVETVDEDLFPMAFWFDDIEDNATRNEMRRLTNDAIAREPLEIIEHVLRNDMPFTEAFTGAFTIINPYSAQSYGLGTGMFEDPNDPNEKIEWTFEEFPQAGLLTTSVFLNRYPDTPTNRNRHRSRMFYKFFLATDVMSLAGREIDVSSINSHNPTLNDSACTVCHEIVDPIAGAFQNWDFEGHYRPLDAGWHGDMVPPGFKDIQIPYEETPQALRWLTSELVQDSKFSLAMVQLVYKGLTGQEPLTEPTEPEDVDYLARIRAFEAQDHVFKQIAEGFTGSEYDLRFIIKELVKSPYFRAVNAEGDLDDQRAMELHDMGTARLLPPEALHRRLISTVGFAWRKNGNDVLLTGDYYKFFYGGIDSISVTDRLTEINGVMANVVDRMANEVACTATAAEFARPVEERMLFPEVELTAVPGGDDAAIRANLVYLHDHLLGESLEPDDPEIDRSYAVFEAVYEDGQAGLMLPENAYPTSLPGPCRATTDPISGEAIPDGQQIVDDPDYTVRAWMAVLTYMLGDYRYLYE